MRIIAAAMLGLLAARGASAQTISVTGAGMAGRVSSSLVYQGTPEEGSGMWVGGIVRLRLGLVSLEGSGLRGVLTPVSDTSGFERDGGEMRGDLAVRVYGGLAIEGSYAMRAFDSPAGYQKWTMVGGGARFGTTLGAPGIRGFLRAHYLASVSLEGGESADLGLRFEGGFIIEPARTPLSLSGFYRFERFDFPVAAGSRLEHFDVLGISLGLRL